MIRPFLKKMALNLINFMSIFHDFSVLFGGNECAEFRNVGVFDVRLIFTEI